MYPTVTFKINTTTAMRLYTQSYEYDELGNIMKMIHLASSGNWTKHYHYTTGFTNNYLLSRSNDGTQGSDEYTYDAHGNMTAMPHLASMGWDYADRLQSADLGGGGDVYYTYDAGGNRVRKVIVKNGGEIDERIYLGDWEVYRAKNSGGTIQLERETLHISDDTGRIARVDTLTVDGGSTVSTPTPVIRYQLSNHLGTAIIELDASTNANVISYEEYHPFGTTSYRSENTSGAISLKRFRYVGKERDDETGLYYYGARYYAAWLARFVSVDPMKDTFIQFNSYNYADNSPIGNLDIDGMQTPTTQVSPIVKSTPKVKSSVSPQVYIDPQLRGGPGVNPGGQVQPPRPGQGIQYAQDQWGNQMAYRTIYRVQPSVYKTTQKPLTEKEYNSYIPTVIDLPGIRHYYKPYAAYLSEFKNQMGVKLMAESDDPFHQNLRRSAQEGMDRQELDRLEQLARNGESLSDSELSRLRELLGKVKGIYLDAGKLTEFYKTQGILDKFNPGSGFTGVFDIKTGEIKLKPSSLGAKPIPLNDGTVLSDVLEQYGGHRPLAIEMGGELNTKLGFSVKYLGGNEIEIGWNSGLNPGRAFPEEYREQVIKKVHEQFPNYNIK